MTKSFQANVFVAVNLLAVVGLMGCATQPSGDVETKKQPVRADAKIVVKGVTCPG